MQHTSTWKIPFFVYKYKYKTTCKLKIIITRHKNFWQRLGVIKKSRPKNKHHIVNNSKRVDMIAYARIFSGRCSNESNGSSNLSVDKI